jgi:ABC-2 type transport system permease protein
MQTFELTMSYVHRNILQWIAWRSFLFTLVVNQAVVPLLGFALWSAALPDDSTLSTYYIVLLVVHLLTVSYEHHTLSNGIYSGSYAGVLLQPQHPVIVVLAENLASRILHLAIGLPMIVALAIIADVSVSMPDVLVAVPALILAAAMRFVFTSSLALSAFWSQRAHATVGFGESMIWLLGGSAIPIAFFPDAAKPFVELLPFRSMMGFPAELATGSLSTRQIVEGFAIQAVWCLVLVWLCAWMWRWGIRRFTAIGG